MKPVPSTESGTVEGQLSGHEVLADAMESNHWEESSWAPVEMGVYVDHGRKDGNPSLVLALIEPGDVRLLARRGSNPKIS